jgi:hypothetical protein
MLYDELLEDFRKGKFELWCPKMIICQKDNEKPFKYSGSGLIRQNQENRIEFVLIEPSSSSISWNLKSLLGDNKEIGKLITNDKYYSLEVTDLSGWVWKAERLLISHSGGSAGSVVFGDIDVLKCIKSPEFQNNMIKLEIFVDIRLPLAEMKRKAVCISENESSFWEGNMTEFKVGEIEISIKKDINVITVIAKSEKTFSGNYLETRIIEALQFVTARTISWGILQKNINEKRITYLHSPEKALLPTNMSLPIDYDHADLEGKWVWLLFGKYLEHIYDFKGDNIFQMHPISGWLHYVRNASGGSIFTKGLGLGVAIEGILECEYSNIGAPSSAYIKAIDEMITYVNSFSGDENLRKRILSSVYKMKKARAKDKLLALQKAGIIREEDLKAWDYIRNSGAHARPPEREELQKWIDNCYKAEVLLNHLIFYAIDYQGQFTDYGSQNWPQSRYSCSITSNPIHPII